MNFVNHSFISPAEFNRSFGLQREEFIFGFESLSLTMMMVAVVGRDD
jgi:hypothetical protein